MKNSKIKVIAFLVVFILFFICAISLKTKDRSILSRDSVQLVSELSSPDNRYKASVFLDTGNATVANSVKVAVTKSSKKKFYASDIIFIQARVDAVDVHWDSNSELRVIYKEDEFSDIFKQVDKLHHVNILYGQ